MLEFLTCETQIHYLSLILRLIRCLQVLLLSCSCGLRWVTASDNHHTWISHLQRWTIVHWWVLCAYWVAEWWLSQLPCLAIWLRWRFATVLALARCSSCLRVHVVSWTDRAGTHRVAMQDGLMDRLAGVLWAWVRSRWVIVRRLYLHCDNSVWDVGEVWKYIECKLSFPGLSWSE